MYCHSGLLSPQKEELGVLPNLLHSYKDCLFRKITMGSNILYILHTWAYNRYLLLEENWLWLWMLIKSLTQFKQFPKVIVNPSDGTSCFRRFLVHADLFSFHWFRVYFYWLFHRQTIYCRDKRNLCVYVMSDQYRKLREIAIRVVWPLLLV